MKYLPYILVFISFELYAQVTVDISSDTVCVGSPTSLRVSSNLNEDLISSYSWDLDYDGYFDDAQGISIQFYFPSPDTFPVAVQILTNDDEIHNSSISKVITNPLPVADFYAKNTCIGDTTLFKNLSYVNNRALVSHKWDFNNDEVTESESIDAQYLFDSSPVDITLTVFTEDGCENSITKEINLFEKPASDFAFNNSCKRDTVNFSNLSTITGDNIVYSIWNFGDRSQSISENAVHAYLTAGIFDVKLINITANNCGDSISKSIEIFELPEVEIIASDTVIFPKDELNLTLVTNSNSITWSTGSVENNISVYSDGMFSVRVEDLNQCKNSDTITIHKLSINEKVIKSEILTPNGDGINDRLEIKEIFRHFSCEVYIYTEWGVQVYNNADYQNDWSCEYDGKILGAGAYYYLIKFDDHSFRGCINILR